MSAYYPYVRIYNLVLKNNDVFTLVRHQGMMNRIGNVASDHLFEHLDDATISVARKREAKLFIKATDKCINNTSFPPPSMHNRIAVLE